MIRLPAVPPVWRSASERAARATTLRAAFGLVAAWPEEWRDELAERVATMEADSVANAPRVAEDAVRVALLRRLA